jgi:hypothetical protein
MNFPAIPEYNSDDPKVIYKLITNFEYHVFMPDAKDKHALHRNKMELESALAAMRNIRTLYPHLPALPKIKDLEHPSHRDFIKVRKWLEHAFDPQLKIKDRDTNEVYWNGEAQEYIDSKWVLRMAGDTLSAPKLSKLLRTQGNTIRWMQTKGKCRVHTWDFIAFMERYEKKDQGFAESALRTFAEIKSDKEKTGRG